MHRVQHIVNQALHYTKLELFSCVALCHSGTVLLCTTNTIILGSKCLGSLCKMVDKHTMTHHFTQGGGGGGGNSSSSSNSSSRKTKVNK